ncbi:MAG: PadR family transcriptional regulator [Azovibrio sp.]
MTDSISTQLKKGVLDLCVLALLAKGDSYAYEIARQLLEAVDMGEGTIYPLMRRLQKDGYVKSYLQESTSGPPRKYYQITETGQTSLQNQRQEWQQFTGAVSRILGVSP